MSFSGKYIAKIFSITKPLVRNIYSNWCVFVRVVGNQGYISRKRICLKIFEQIRIDMAYLHVF